MADWKSPTRADPSEWLVVNACAPIRYRVLTELHSLTDADPNVAKVRDEVMAWAPAKKELRYQRQDGSWGGKIHAPESKKADRCTEKVLWQFAELGWDKDLKEIKAAIKLLRSFLTVKKDLNLFEFKTQVKQDPVRERHVRWFLRILSLGLLLRIIPEDKRVLTGVADLIERVSAFVASPISRAPVETIGAGLPQIRREAMQDGYCFIPDMYILRVFAHCEALLGGKRMKANLKKIFDYVLSPAYQELGPEIGSVRTVRGPIPRGYGIELHPVEYYVDNGCVEELLFILENFARLGLINRYPLLMSYVDWLLSEQKKDGLWDLPAKSFGGHPLYDSWFRLEKDWKSPNRRIADVTFRIMVILKYQWDRQAVMLERGRDLYGI